MTPAARRAAVWVAFVLFAAGLVGYLIRDARERDYRACVEANGGRAVIRQFIVSVIDDDGQRTDFESRLLFLMDRDLGPRDCKELR